MEARPSVSDLHPSPTTPLPRRGPPLASLLLGLAVSLSACSDDQGAGGDGAHLADASGDWFFKVRADWVDNYYHFYAGDELHFGNEYNNKYVYVMRSGTKILMGDRLLWGSRFPIIFPGDNQFQFTPNNTYLTITEFKYRHAFWGV